QAQGQVHQAPASPTPAQQPAPQQPAPASPSPVAVNLPPIKGELVKLIEDKCAKCHSGAKVGGGVDLSNPGAISFEGWLEIHNSVRVGSMPKGADPLGNEDFLMFDVRYGELFPFRKRAK
ncbi:MAG TPA: hypothetical protein VEI97_17285, partial [bacterium]|nr:hypothetical protein [bacterium]